MKEVVIIRIADGKPIEEPEFLSETYACKLAHYKALLWDIKTDRCGDAGSLLDGAYELKKKLSYIRQALHGKYNIIVIVDLTVPRQLLIDAFARWWE